MTSVVTEKSDITLSVVIPAYNEANRLPAYLAAVIPCLAAGFGGAAEIIVVDDGSVDSTAAEAARADDGSGLVRVIRLQRNRGKGFAVKTGMLAARGRLRLFTDADGATPIEEVHKLLAAVESGADIAVASRALRDESRTVKSTFVRKVLGNGYNVLVRCLTVPGIRDTQCGFKLFRGEVAERLFSNQVIPGFGFDPEVLFLAHKLAYRIAEVPVNWQDVSGSKVNIMEDSLRMFSDLFRIRLRWLAGAYQRLPETEKPEYGKP